MVMQLFLFYLDSRLIKIVLSACYAEGNVATHEGSLREILRCTLALLDGCSIHTVSTILSMPFTLRLKTCHDIYFSKRAHL